MHTHTNIAQGLKLSLPLAWVFHQCCDILAWHVIKKCHRFWWSDFRCSLLPMGRSDGSEGGNDELELDHACKLSPRGHITFLLWHDGSSLFFRCSPPLLSSPPGLASRCFFPSVTHGQEIWAWPRAQSHLHSLDMSWLCTEAQTAGYQIRAQGLFFHSALFVYRHRLFSQSLFSLCFFLSLLLSSHSSLSSPSLFGDGVTQVSRLRNEYGGFVQTTGKMFHFSFLLLHLSNSPLHLSIRVWDCRSLPDWPGSRFLTQITGIICSLKNCASALLWVFVNLQGLA